MRDANFVILFLGLLQLAGPAMAARKDTEEAAEEREARERLREAKEKAAKKACLNGDPAKGVEILTDLFVDHNDPTYIFNQGRCYEQNNRYEEAIGRFREYLRKTPGRNESDRAEALQHIADCEALAKKAAEPPTPPAAPVVVLPPVAPPAPPAYPVPPPARVEDTGGRGASGGSGLRVAGVIAMVAGVGGLATGIGLNLKYNSMMSDLMPGESSDSARPYLTWSLVGYGAGAALLVGGVTLYLLGRSAGATAVVPATVAGHPGAMWTGQF